MCNRTSHCLVRMLLVFFCMLQWFCMSLADAQNVMVSETAEQLPSPATSALDNLLARYPPGSIHTNEDASRAGEDVHKMHALIEKEFSDEQKTCFPKFFATSCLLDAKERHRVALAKVRVIEIEVNKFKRRANVMAREKALAAKHDNESVERVDRPNENHNPVAASVPESPQTLPSPPAKKPQSNANARIVKHQTVVKKRQAEEGEN